MGSAATSRRGWVINGRFLSEPASGVQRVAAGFVRCLSKDSHILACPRGTRPAWWTGQARQAPLPPGRPGRLLWEQLALPALAGGRPVLSLANTAPLVRAHLVLVQDLAFLAHPEWFRPSFRRSYGAVTAQAASRSRRVLVPSAFTAGELMARLGIPAARISVVTPGIDDRFVPPSEADVGRVRAAHRLEGPFLLAVGTLDPRKGLDTAARAAQMAGLPLVVAGASAASFTGATVPSGVRWLGRVPDGDLPGLYGSAAALLYPSRYEGFGLPPLEAMACGALVVAADIPPLRETLSGASVLVAPDEPEKWAEAVRSVTSDASHRAGEMRAASRKRAAAYTWASAGLGLDAVLDAWPDAP